MRRMVLLAGLLAAASCVPGGFGRKAAEPLAMHFDADTAEEAAWTPASGTWAVVDDPTAPSRGRAMAQTARRERPDFNVALASTPALRDLNLSVSLRAVSGEIDQGGGPVWRARDGLNYYICRWNPLEKNLRVYKVVDGKRTQLGTADVEAGPGWHTIGVAMKGDRIACWFDGTLYLEVQDTAFAEAGRVGLWTKADAVTHFDDLVVGGR